MVVTIAQASIEWDGRRSIIMGHGGSIHCFRSFETENSLKELPAHPMMDTEVPNVMAAMAKRVQCIIRASRSYFAASRSSVVYAGGSGLGLRRPYWEREGEKFVDTCGTFFSIDGMFLDVNIRNGQEIKRRIKEILLKQKNGRGKKSHDQAIERRPRRGISRVFKPSNIRLCLEKAPG